MTRVLVVEDEPGIAFALEADLRTEGYDVVLVTRGDDALRVARAERFDLILLDVMLPGNDGFDVCRHLRRGGLKTPIILLTAKSQEAEKVMGLELGADDYVTKPFSPRELRARIRARLRDTGGSMPDVFAFGDAEVDFHRCEARRAGQAVELSALEYKLLAVFIRSRGRVLSREQLIDAAWGGGASVTERVVDNHIVALRRKLEPDPSQPRFFVNVRGLGYRFEG